MSNKNAWSKVIGRAWADDDFKNRLLAAPSAVLAEYDLEYPKSTVVVEDDSAAIGDWHYEGEGDGRHIVIPIPPAPPSFDVEITDSALSAAAGGSSGGTAGQAAHAAATVGDAGADACDACTCSTCV